MVQFNDIFAYPVYKKVYLHQGWLGILNYTLMLAIASYVVLFPMLYSKEYLDCFTVNSQVLFGSPTRPSGAENDVCNAIGAPRETGVALNGMYYRVGCDLNHSLPAFCVPVDPATQVLSSPPGSIKMKMREINVPHLNYPSALTEQQCKALLGELYEDLGRCNEMYSVNASTPLAGLTDAVHFDANALDIIFPLTFGLDTSQAKLLQDTKLCGQNLPNSTDAAATCGNASEVVIREDSCAESSSVSSTSLTYMVTLGTIVASIEGLDEHPLLMPYDTSQQLPKPRSTGDLMRFCESELSLPVTEEAWEKLVASSLGLKNLWSINRQLISNLDSNEVLKNATTLSEFKDLVSALCQTEAVQARVTSLLMNAEILITATFDNIRNSRGSFSGPYSPVEPTIRLNSQVIFSTSPISTVKSGRTPMLHSFQVSGLGQAVDEVLYAQPGISSGEVSTSVMSNIYGIEMTTHVGGKVCTINVTYAVLILLQAVTLVTAASSIMVFLVSYVLPHKTDYNSHFKDHAYRFDGSNWLTSLLSRKHDGKPASTAGSSREPGSDYNVYKIPSDLEDNSQVHPQAAAAVGRPDDRGATNALTSGMQNGAQKSLAEWAIGE